MSTSSEDDEDCWRALADAFFLFASERSASMILVCTALRRPSDSAERLVIDQVGLLLARWRDTPEKRDSALALWAGLSHPEARKALVEAVRERFTQPA